jgi:hypothetical protein
MQPLQVKNIPYFHLETIKERLFFDIFAAGLDCLPDRRLMLIMASSINLSSPSLTRLIMISSSSKKHVRMNLSVKRTKLSGELLLIQLPYIPEHYDELYKMHVSTYRTEEEGDLHLDSSFLKVLISYSS